MRSFRSLTVAAALAAAACTALGADLDPDADPRFRARLIKEKSKMNAEETNPALKPREIDGAVPPVGECGSQNIGNVSTGGRPGSMPREIFVFAPNAINIVSGRGCGNN